MFIVTIEASSTLWNFQYEEILKGYSKRIWHGDLMENLTEEERRLILPMMKNYIEKYTPAVC